MENSTRAFVKPIRTVPAAALAAVTALSVVFFREDQVAFRSAVKIFRVQVFHFGKGFAKVGKE